MASDTRTLRVVVVGDSTSAQRSIRDVGREGDKLKEKSGALSVALGTMAASGASKLLDLAGSAVTTGVKTASAFQQSQVAFTNMLGSGEKAQQFIASLQKMAAATPFEFPDLVEASQRLMAMGIAAKNVVPDLTAIGDAAAAMGGGPELIDQMTNALGQMQAKGHVAGDELLQMTEAGIPALQILAAQYGVSTSKMQDMISKGKVLSSDAIPKLIAGMENGTKSTQKFGGMMQAQSQTLAGKWSTLSDTVTTGLGNMFSKAMPAMNAGIDFLSNAAGKVFNGISAKAGPVAAYIKGLFTNDIVPAAKSMWAVVGPLLQQFGSFLATVWNKVQPLKQIPVIFGGIRDVFGFIETYKQTFQTLAVGILAIVAAQKAWTTAVTIWTAVTKVAAAVQAAWDAAMDANPIGLIVLAITGLVAGIVYAWNHFAGFRNFVLTVWGAIKSAAQAVASWFMSYVWPTLVAVFNGVAGAAKVLWSVISFVFNVIRAIVMGVVQFFMSYVWPVLKGVFDVIAGAVRILYGAFKIYFEFIQIVVKALVYLFMTYVWPIIKTYIGFIVSIVKTLWSVFSSYFGFIRDKVSTVVNWFRSTAWPVLSAAFNLIKGAVQTLWDKWKSIFDSIKSKVETVMNGAKAAFANAKDAIGNTWAKLQDLAKKPVNFVIDTVYNNGIRRFWNAIASKVGAKPLDSIPKLAGGGRGIPSVSSIVGDWVPFFGQAGEYVLNRKQVAMAGGWRGIESLFGPAGRDGASGGHYDKGGILGGLASAGSWLKDKAVDLVKGSLLTIAAPLINTIKSAINLVPGTGEIANAVRGLPTNALNDILAWIKPRDKAPDVGNWDGTIAPGVIGRMQQWALAQRGKVYQWAAVGPSTYDCSGLVGNLWAIATGNPLYRRYFTTDTMGVGRFGMVSGPGAFTVYLSKSGGHTAANVGGLHVEAYHGNGTPLAIGRIGTRLSYYQDRLHLPGLAKGGTVPDMAERLASFVQRGWPEPPAGVAVPHNFTPLEWRGVDKQLYDSGGILPPGMTLAVNGTGRNEYVSTDAPGAHVTVNVTVQGNVTAERDLAESIATAVRDALLRKAARNGGKTGLK